MKRQCLLCNRTSLDGNLWCQEKGCSSGQKITLMECGEWLGEIEILNTLAVLPTATVYVGKRGTEQIFVKLAHDGFEDKLVRESAFLHNNQLVSYPHPVLPVLLPAFSQAKLGEHPYGKTVFDGRTRFYYVTKFTEGELLHNVLLKNPQPWYQHVGWLIISLADAVAYLHKLGKLHCCLSPRLVLVRYDRQGIPRPILLDLGMACSADEVTDLWSSKCSVPAYTAPELLVSEGSPGKATDVYGLGLILYEMLAGTPAYEYALLREELVIKRVLKALPARMDRSDLSNVSDVAEQAIQKSPARRQPDVVAFAQQLSRVFPPLPREKRKRKTDWKIIAIVTGAVMAISLLLAAAVLFV